MNLQKAEARSHKPAEARSASIEVRIEELVLHGFPPGDRYHIGEAVQRELSRMFDEQGTPLSLIASRETDRVDGGSFQTTPRSNAEEIGKQVARAVYGGMIL